MLVVSVDSFIRVAMPDEKFHNQIFKNPQRSWWAGAFPRALGIPLEEEAPSGLVGREIARIVNEFSFGSTAERD